jgi:hypothetical protein
MTNTQQKQLSMTFHFIKLILPCHYHHQYHLLLAVTHFKHVGKLSCLEISLISSYLIWLQLKENK